MPPAGNVSLILSVEDREAISLPIQADSESHSELDSVNDQICDIEHGIYEGDGVEKIFDKVFLT